MRKALVLAGGIPQIELIKELKKRGYYVLLADYSEHPVAEEYADKFYQESTLNIEGIRKIAIEEKVNLILTCCTDQALATVSILSEELGLPCYIDAKTGMNVTNKRYMKRILEEQHIPTAKYLFVKDEAETVEIDFPAVVKPVDCNSSKGVVKVTNYSELKEAMHNAILYSRTKSAIIEQFVEGEEVSVDAFVVEGKATILCTSVSEKIKDKEKFVIYKGYYPAPISNMVYKKIEKVVQSIVDAFELKNCPLLVQMIVRDEDVYVVEFSARTGGCVKHRMIKYASGIDVISNMVDLLEGKSVLINPVMSECCVVDEFVYCKAGTYGGVEGLEKCINNGWIKEGYVLKSNGTIMSGVNSSGDRIAALVYVVEDNAKYIEYHNEVISRLKILDINGTDIMRHDLLPELV